MDYCNHGNYSSVNMAALEKHTRSVHPAEGVIICGECAKSFVSYQEGYRHVNNHNASETGSDEVPIYPCDLYPTCNQLFLSIKELNHHKKTTHVEINTIPDRSQDTILAQLLAKLESLEIKFDNLSDEFKKQNSKLHEIQRDVKVSNTSVARINQNNLTTQNISQQYIQQKPKPYQQVNEIKTLISIIRM